MKLTMKDEESKKVKAVLVDGKRVVMPIAFDTDEGWVDVLVPNIQKEQSIRAGSQVDIENAGTTELDWQNQRIQGKIEVLWYENTPSISD
jgi:hypothetical protein